jgi:hypothetical protein
MIKKICICLTSDYYLKYINYEAFKILEKKYKVTYLINSRKFKKKDLLNQKRVIYYNTLRANDARVQRLYLVIRERFKKKSKTFEFVNHYFHPDFKNHLIKKKIVFKNLSFIKKLKHFFNYYIFLFYKILIIKILSNKLIYKLSYSYFTFFLNKNNDLKNKIIKENADLVIYPTHLYESEVFSLISITSKLNIKSLYLIDNWDNLSTKTVMLDKPNYLAVWGQQTKEHAIKIHKFKNDKVFLLGNPKFDFFKKNLNKKIKKVHKFKYVLFLGVREETDEITPLITLDNEIEKNKNFYNNLKIIYRPHPYNSKKVYSRFINLRFKNVKFDISSDLGIYKKNTRSSSILKKDYYLSLLKNSLFVVGGITTVVMEALLLNKNYIVLSHFDKKNFLSTRNLFSSFEHFKKVEHIKNIYLSKNQQDLIKSFRNIYLGKKIKKNNFINLLYFFYFNKKNYSENLYNICKKILK